MKQATPPLALRPSVASSQYVFALPDHHVWCGSVEALPNGGYFMAYSRWPFAYGFDAWVSHSRIGIAVSDSMLGPYRHLKMAFKEGSAAPPVQHNPALLRWHNHHYFLLFTGTSGPWSWKNGPPPVDIGEDRPEWWEHRNNQRVWIASAADPLGEWEVRPQPLFEPEPGYITTGTPFVFRRPDGKLQFVVKTVREGDRPVGGQVEHHTFLADTPEGPFTKVSDCLLPGMKTRFPFDDHCQFWHNGSYYTIIKDHGEGLIGETPVLLLLQSASGFDWRIAPDPMVTPFHLQWDDGKPQSYERLEMPRLLFENGRPAALQLSAYKGRNTKSFNLRVPLHTTPAPVESKSPSLAGEKTGFQPELHQ